MQFLTCSIRSGLQKLLRLLVRQMFKENLFGLNVSAGDSSDIVAGGGESGATTSIRIS